MSPETDELWAEGTGGQTAGPVAIGGLLTNWAKDTPAKGLAPRQRSGAALG